MVSHNASRDAQRFGELFPSVYARFHRRDGKRSELPGASRAVLSHLAMTGPLTIGEMTRHLDRAQSVVSEIVDHLERDELLERVQDPQDRRRTLVWLTDTGLAYLEQQREVLSRSLLEQAMRRMTPNDRAALLRGMQALIAAEPLGPESIEPTQAPRRKA